MTSESNQEQDTKCSYLETSCFEVTARKQCFLAIYVYFTDIVAIVSAVFFASYFLLFVTFCPTSPTSQFNMLIYGKRSLPHLGYGHARTQYTRSAALFDAHRQRCHVDCSCTACILACRRSARGMCSMNTSSVFK